MPRTGPGAGLGPAKAAMISRSAENTVGRRLRCSSVKISSLAGIEPPSTLGVRRHRRASTWRRPRASAAAITGSSTAPRSFRAVARDPPAAGDDLHRRVEVGEVPAAVPARVLHAGAEHAAGPVLDLPGDLVKLGWRRTASARGARGRRRQSGSWSGSISASRLSCPAARRRKAKGGRPVPGGRLVVVGLLAREPWHRLVAAPPACDGQLNAHAGELSRPSGRPGTRPAGRQHRPASAGCGQAE